METMKDSRGNIYFDVKNIRVTAIANTWANIPGIRIQAYKSDGGLFQGAELPLKDKTTAFDLLNAIFRAIEEIGIE